MNAVPMAQIHPARRLAAVAGLVAVLALVAGLVPAPTRGAVTIGFSRLVSGIANPVAIANAGDGSGRLFVVEQDGRIWIVRAGRKLATPFLDLRAKASCCGERGLLGLAFHPSYETNRRLYVYYTDNSGNITVSQFTGSAANPNRASSTERVLLRIAHRRYSNHNGGGLAFGRDGYLYIGTGDGGGAGDPLESGQNRRALLGKILRIDVNRASGGRNYAIPSTNPYARSTTYRREIWAFGVRNPWRISFDRSTGDLWIGDVGQGRYEEVNRARRAAGGGRGTNFGWDVMEGRACYEPASGCSTAGKVRPLAVYSHGANGCSITGGYVYRGSRYPVLRGLYLFGDYCSGRIWRVRAGGASSQAPVLLRDTGMSITTFGEDEAGEVYVADYNTGTIYRITGR